MIAKYDHEGKYPWGNQTPTEEHANYNSINQSTVEVGSYPKGQNSFGIMDLSGNASEWTNNWFGEKSEIYTKGNFIATEKICKGGSWLSPEEKITISEKEKFKPDNSFYNVGFRIIRIKRLD